MTKSRTALTFFAICLTLVCVVHCFAMPASALAQQPAPAPAGVSAPAPPPQAPSLSHPAAFYRGNAPGLNGFYVNLFAFIPVLGLFFLWVKLSAWIDEDSDALKVRRDFWNSIVVVSGLVAFLLALIMPAILLGGAACLIVAGVPIGMYIVERNAQVPASGRVMTPRHLKKVANQTLGRFGVHFGEREGGVDLADVPIEFIGKSSQGGDREEDRSRQVKSSRGYQAAKELVYDAIQRRATDVHLEPSDGEMAIRLRIDGVMFPAEPFDMETGNAVINIFKVLGAMDITEKRRPQDGSFRAEVADRFVDFRSATQGTRYGQKISLRLLDQGNVVAQLAKLGMRKGLYEKISNVISEPHGLMLCCGPTGAGKSTTLYAGINSIDRYGKNIITIEDPVEYRMEGVNQIEINTKAGQTFAGTLRSVLRQDPDVVLVGEIRDAETAGIACQAANTGHMVLSTIHANDTITALFRLLELGVEPFMVANSLSGLIGQRLVRRLCPDCRVAYKPKPEFLQKVGIPPKKVDVFYKPPAGENDCETCGGTGFRGRIGVYEFLQMSDELSDLVREKASMNAIKAEARKNGMLSMREEGLRLIVRGVTSVDELLRVVK
ncbi:GspE/PulE family protein [Stratiformator vulcanicus]|uniref:Type II secretion system protein E n=1 Tax=Stratiformator vulcanicus TaxID=2527980 RepID=A0A517R4H5_9PLAN|nr:GspE/PulE family protein [Stratiformator vulcanicus]QDT38777.1 Type II secretion system protein E [Stratiformator vulcanicus]